ncbi:MAG: VOC family protein [Chloroflexi bacterium]|nr:VOC family protein [Chloroflexota bacterium]
MDEAPKPVSGIVDTHLARHGKVAFIELPARDPITSAVFYEAVFGWTLSPPIGERVAYTLGPRDNASVPFSDTPSGLIGAFVASRGPSPDGPVVHIYVEDIDYILHEIEARGCEILEPVHTERGVRVAQFRDPGRNVIGIWEQGAD